MPVSCLSVADGNDPPPCVRSVGSFPAGGFTIGVAVNRLLPQHFDLTAFTTRIRVGTQ